MKQFIEKHAATMYAVMGIITYGFMFVATVLKWTGLLIWSWWIILSPILVCAAIVAVLSVVYYIWIAYIKYATRTMEEVTEFPSHRSLAAPPAEMQRHLLRQVNAHGEGAITVDIISKYFGNVERFTEWANENNLFVTKESESRYALHDSRAKKEIK